MWPALTFPPPPPPADPKSDWTKDDARDAWTSKKLDATVLRYDVNSWWIKLGGDWQAEEKTSAHDAKAWVEKRRADERASPR